VELLRNDLGHVGPLNPPEDPKHCPAGVPWLMSVAGGRISPFRLYHPADGDSS